MSSPFWFFPVFVPLTYIGIWSLPGVCWLGFSHIRKKVRVWSLKSAPVPEELSLLRAKAPVSVALAPLPRVASVLCLLCRAPASRLLLLHELHEAALARSCEQYWGLFA